MIAYTVKLPRPPRDVAKVVICGALLAFGWIAGACTERLRASEASRAGPLTSLNAAQVRAAVTARVANALRAAEPRTCEGPPDASMAAVTAAARPPF